MRTPMPIERADLIEYECDFERVYDLDGPLPIDFGHMERMFPGLSAVSVDLHVPVRNRPGYVSRDESALIAGLARWKDPDVVFEFGTFDGLTTLNIAKNIGPSARIYTLDLPPDVPEKHRNDTINRQFVDAPDKDRFRPAAAAAGDVVFLSGDSAVFDFTSYQRRCDFIFVDASHTYENVLRDSITAYEIARNGAIIIWHDYNKVKFLPGVTTALNQARKRLGIDLYWLSDSLIEGTANLSTVFAIR